MPWDDSGLWNDSGTWQDGALPPNDPGPGTIIVSAHTVNRPGVSVDFSHGDIEVHADHKLKHADGTPFIPISDTCWALLRNLSREDIDAYLEDRREKGFTCITTRAVCVNYVLGEGEQEPNFYGHIQFDGDDLGSPNEDYFTDLDYIIDAAASRGIFVNLAVWRKTNPGWNTAGSNTTNMYDLGFYLGTRYADRSNIFWKLGFDAPMTTLGVDNWRAMRDGLDDGSGGKFVAEYHFNPGTQVKDTCFEVVGTQTGHGFQDDTSFWNAWGPTAWAAPYPVWNVEPCYEDLPWQVINTNPRFTGTDIRTQAYWTVFSGACGTGYGNFAITELFRPGDEAYTLASENNCLPSDYWYNALDFSGATSMAILRELLDSRPFLDLVPDQGLVTNASSGATHLACAKGTDYAYIYSPFGYGFTVNMGRISGSEVFGFWFNPRNGETSFVGRYANSGTRFFDPPGNARGEDMVLILDDIDAGYLLSDAEITPINNGAIFLSGQNIGVLDAPPPLGMGTPLGFLFLLTSSIDIVEIEAGSISVSGQNIGENEVTAGATPIGFLFLLTTTVAATAEIETISVDSGNLLWNEINITEVDLIGISCASMVLSGSEFEFIEEGSSSVGSRWVSVSGSLSKQRWRKLRDELEKERAEAAAEIAALAPKPRKAVRSAEKAVETAVAEAARINAPELLAQAEALVADLHGLLLSDLTNKEIVRLARERDAALKPAREAAAKRAEADARDAKAREFLSRIQDAADEVERDAKRLRQWAAGTKGNA